MSAQLSRLSKLGIAKETTAGTFVAPTIWVPFEKAEFIDVFMPLKDQSYRANDTVLQGVYQGIVDGTWSIDVLAYPDLTGYWLRSVIGPDTVTAGVSTVLSADTTAGATSVTTAVTIPSGSTIQIQDAGGLNTEYATTGTPTGSGPFTIPIVTPTTGLRFAHTASGGSVSSATTHTFKQNPTAAKATYSLLVWDTNAWTQYTYGVGQELQIKIDPKAAISISVKLQSLAGVAGTTQTPTFTALAPALGWQWQSTTAGASNTRGLSFDATVKRQVDPIHSSDAIQAAREIFQGALEVDGTYKAIFENTTDLALYTSNIQQPVVATLVQPVSQGGNGSTLTLTMSQSAWTTGKRDLSGDYVTADFSLSGVYNSTDGGAVQAVLKNFQTSAY